MRRVIAVGRASVICGAVVTGIVLLVLGLSSGPPATVNGRQAAPQGVRTGSAAVVATGPRRIAATALARTSPAMPAVDIPRAVAIPRLAVAAPVVGRVGVIAAGTEKGLLSAPGDYHDLGWYRNGVTGALVVDGHVGYASGAGPLAYIGMLSRGDTIVVTYPGRVQTYRVAAVSAVLKGGLPAAYFTAAYSRDLVLITCDYQSAFHDGHFADNVYVLATPSR